MTCPVCHKDLGPETMHRPFCSERCKLIDLGRWLGEGYRVPGHPDSEEDSGPGLTPLEDEEI
ncbi:MAG: DNA gyrase inhibitor YacG [Pseudomonadota bacterium]